MLNLIQTKLITPLKMWNATTHFFTTIGCGPFIEKYEDEVSIVFQRIYSGDYCDLNDLLTPLRKRACTFFLDSAKTTCDQAEADYSRMSLRVNDIKYWTRSFPRANRVPYPPEQEVTDLYNKIAIATRADGTGLGEKLRVLRTDVRTTLAGLVTRAQTLCGSDLCLPSGSMWSEDEQFAFIRMDEKEREEMIQDGFDSVVLDLQVPPEDDDEEGYDAIKNRFHAAVRRAVSPLYRDFVNSLAPFIDEGIELVNK